MKASAQIHADADAASEAGSKDGSYLGWRAGFSLACTTRGDGQGCCT